MTPHDRSTLAAVFWILPSPLPVPSAQAPGRHRGGIVNREAVVQAVWPEALEEGVRSRPLMPWLRRLRERLAELEAEHQYVSPCAATASVLNRLHSEGTHDPNTDSDAVSAHALAVALAIAGQWVLRQARQPGSVLTWPLGAALLVWRSYLRPCGSRNLAAIPAQAPCWCAIQMVPPCRSPGRLDHHPGSGSGPFLPHPGDAGRSLAG